MINFPYLSDRPQITETDGRATITFGGWLRAVERLVRPRPTTVGNLPSAADAGQGARAFVTDATATTFASTVVGGGSNAVPVYSNGSNWKVG